MSKNIQLLSSSQDTASDVKFLQQAIQQASITGNEAQFVAYLKDQMALRNLNPQQADFLPGRPNIWGERKGTGAGPRLLFMGHTDTVHVQDWKEAWAGTEREDPFAGVEVDGAIWGRGSVDLKGGICAALAALDLLDQSEIKLNGDIAFAFVGDEESGEPKMGVSAGIKDYVARVVKNQIQKPDFAIYVEPTQLQIYTSQIGFFIADVTITGKTAYFGKPELGVDAFKAMHAIQTAIWKHSKEIEAAGEHNLVGRSGALITEIRGGGYIAVPGSCFFSLIRKLRPAENLDEAVAAFEAVVRAVPVESGINIQFSYPAGRDHHFGGSPAEINPALPEVSQLQTAISQISKKETKIGGAPYWSETPFLINHIGCPAVYCAPGDISVAHTTEERINIEEYLASIRAFALFIANYCGVVLQR